MGLIMSCSALVDVLLMCITFWSRCSLQPGLLSIYCCTLARLALRDSAASLLHPGYIDVGGPTWAADVNVHRFMGLRKNGDGCDADDDDDHDDDDEGNDDADDNDGDD